MTSLPARAADLEWSAQARAVVSDNIHRSVPDLEREGSILSLDTTLVLRDSKGRASYALLGKGGWETLDDGVEEPQDEDLYLLRGTAQVPVSVDGTLEGSYESSRAIEAPEPTAILQERTTIERDRGQIQATWRPSSRAEWRVRGAAANERRADRETEEVEAGLSSTFPAGRRVSLTLEAAQVSGVGGSEGLPEDTWRKRSAALALGRQSGRLASGVLKVDWQSSDLERGQTGETEESERYGASYSFGFSLAEGWTMNQAVGIDGLKSGGEPVQWEGRLEVTLADALDATNRAQLNLYTRPIIQNASEGSVIVRRETGAQASLEWRASRALTITPSLLFRVNESLDSGVAEDRYTDSIKRVRADWAVSKTWTVSLAGASETRDSTPDTLDLYENRLELAVSGVFL